MTLTSDIILNYPLWERADDELCNTKGKYGLFSRLVDLFIIACSIGIKEDKTFNEFESLDSPKSIGRTTYQSATNADLNELLLFMMQNAVLGTKTITLDVDERLKLAFDPDYNNKTISPTGLLIGFANYGLNSIYEHISSETDIVAIDELENYFSDLIKPDYTEILNLINMGE